MVMRIPVRISDIVDETPTVKVLRLDLQGSDFVYSPGQWIDCYVELDGRLEIVGYTITSSPTLEGEIEIAVREGDNPVTRFIHEGASVGDTLYVEGGQGDFYYSREMGDSVVLIGGGIGITPLMSILRYVDDAHPDVRVTLMYSVSKPSEIVFREELDNISTGNENIQCIVTVTRPEDERWSGRVGRIDRALLEEVEVNLEALFFLCCPAPMTESMTKILHETGVPSERIKYEQWW